MDDTTTTTLTDNVLSLWKRLIVSMFALINARLGSNLTVSFSTPTPTTLLPPPTSLSPTSLSPTFAPEQLLTTRQGTFAILERVPHDTSAFTQGLHILPHGADNSTFLVYEGTGLYGESELRQVDLPTGQVLQRQALAPRYFGEGITYYTDNATEEGRIMQLTWKSKTGFVYNCTTTTTSTSVLEPLHNFTFSTTTEEGWGITATPDTFVVSDGSSFLHIWNQTTLEEIRTVQVMTRMANGNSIPVPRLNELEWDPDTETILANVWLTDTIVRINVETGRVVTRYDLSTLFPSRPWGADVLNGIALVPFQKEQYWITGKKWPFLFRVRLYEE